jgi:putative hemolysin
MFSTLASDLAVISLLLFVHGLLALAEMAIVSSRKPRLNQRASDGNLGAKAALELAKDPTNFLASIQTAITLVSVLLCVFAGATVARSFASAFESLSFLAPYAGPLSLSLVVLILTFLSLLVGELVPKQVALSAPEKLASLVSVPLRRVSRIFYPAVQVLTFATSWSLRLLAIKPSLEPPVTEDEVRTLIEQGAQAGVFHKDEGKILKRVLRLDDMTVSDIMTPRTTIESIDIRIDRKKMIEMVLASHHYVFPVYDHNPDNFTGTISARSVLDPNFSTSPDVTPYVVNPHYVSESMPVLKLLSRLKLSNRQVAIVVDEYGSSCGIVTVTDLMEAIVGDIPDDSSDQSSSVVKRRDGSILIDGMLNIHEFNEVLNLKGSNQIPDTDFQTVGGFVMAQLGRIPKEADRFSWGSWSIEVIDMDARRVDKVLAISTKKKKKPKTEDA